MESAITALRVVVCVCGTLWAVMAGIEAYAFYEDFYKKYERDIRVFKARVRNAVAVLTGGGCCADSESVQEAAADIKASALAAPQEGLRSMRLFLWVNTTATIFTSVIVGIMAFAPPHSLSPLACDVLARLAPSGYGLATQMVYLFFMKKAQLVGRFERSRFYVGLAKACWLAMVVFMPLIVLPLALALFDGRVTTSTGICVMETRYVFLPILFGVGNLAFSGALLFLFVYPLHQNAKHVRHGNKHASKRVVAVARENIRLTIVALTSTLLAITFMTASFIINLTTSDHDFADMLLVIDIAVIFFDIPVNSLMAHLMTNAWMPQRLKHILKSEISEDSGEGGSSTTNVKRPMSLARKSFRKLMGGGDELVPVGGVTEMSSSRERVLGHHQNGSDDDAQQAKKKMHEENPISTEGGFASPPPPSSPSRSTVTTLSSAKSSPARVYEVEDEA